MARLPIVIIILSCALISAAFCEEAHQLERIVVTPSRIQSFSSQSGRSITVLDRDALESTSYQSISDAIGNIGGIDIRRRGVEGVQSDVSIRGTTFDQNTVLIDGIPVNDPQTGHHTMDVALTMDDVEQVEILKGPASSLYGANSFGGVINIITKRPDEKKVTLESYGGSFDYFSGAFSVSYPAGPIKNRFSFEERRSSGYMPETEFNILSFSDSASVDTFLGEYNFLFGYSKKDFGAADFYSNLYPNEEEHTDTRFFKIDGHAEAGALTIKPNLFLRRHWDKFALDTNRPGWQTNYHTTYSYGGGLSFILENQVLDTAYGFDLSRDTIDSTNLQKHERGRGGAYLEVSPHLLDNLCVKAGVREDYFGDFGWECSPSASVSYNLLEHYTIRSSVGRSYRIPTFTDLYYRDAANIGNPGLKPESSWSYDFGLDCTFGAVSSSATFFRRNSFDTIDWTRMSSKDPWRISNIGSVDTNGFELSLTLTPKKIMASSPIDKVFFNYTALDSYNKHDYLSKYVSDYLKQQISSGLEYDIFGFRNIWVLNYKKRIGDSGFIVVDTKITKDIIKKDKLHLEAFLEISNLFDVKYSEQSDITMPGRWIKSGARLEF